MTAFMIIVVISLFIVLVGFSWYRLEAFEGVERTILCVAGILLSWGMTSILFSMSSKGIDFMNVEVEKEISKILIIVFTPINGIVFMPYLSGCLSKFKFEEISKQNLVQRLVILAIVIIVVCVIEVNYLKNIQLGIIDVANSF